MCKDDFIVIQDIYVFVASDVDPRAVKCFIRTSRAVKSREKVSRSVPNRILCRSSVIAI